MWDFFFIADTNTSRVAVVSICAPLSMSTALHCAISVLVWRIRVKLLVDYIPEVFTVLKKVHFVGF